MSVGQLQIQVDSSMAERGLKAMADRVKQLENELAKSAETTETTGSKWTELASKFNLAGSAIGLVTSSLDGLDDRIKQASKLSQQINRIGADDLQQLRDMTGDLIAPDKIIAMETLFRKYNITTEQTGNVLKGIIAISREQGKDASELAGNITEGIISGSRDVLENYGIMVQTMTDKDKQRIAILDQFKAKYGEMNVAAESYADKEAKRQNQRAIQDANNLEALGENLNYWKQAKDHILNVRDYTLSFIMTGNWPVENALNSFNKKWSDQYDIVAKIRQDIEKTGTQFKTNSNAFEQYMTGQKVAAKATDQDLKLNRKLVEELEKQVNLLDIRNNYAGNHNKLTADMLKEASRARSELVKQKKVLHEMVINSDAYKNAFLSMADRILPQITGLMDRLNPKNWEAAKAAKATKQATDEQLLNYKLMLIARGANIDLSGKLLNLLNKQTFEQMKQNEYEKALAFNKALSEKQVRRETEELEKQTPQYELQGKYLNEKNRLEKAYQKEAQKGDKADIFKLQAISAEMEVLKKRTELGGKLYKQISEQKNVDYTGLIQNEKQVLELRQLEEQRDLAIKMGKFEVAAAIQKNVDLAYKEAEANAEANLKFKQKMEMLNAVPSIYGKYADSQQLSLQMQKEEIALAQAKLGTDKAAIISSMERINALKQQAETLGQFSLKMKEWEQSSYGALGAVKNIWQASGDAILMTDAQLRKAGKTRAQVIKQAVQAQILALGKQNLFEGGTNLAKGFAATAMGNPAAAGFFKAAGIHFAVAAAAGIGNSLFGGGGGGKQEDKAKTAPTTNVSTTNQQSSTTIINFQNGMLFGSVDELARGVDSVLKDAGRRGQI